MTDRLEVGRITKAHGLRGEVIVVLTTDRPERVAAGAVLHDRDDHPMVVASSRPHQNGWIVQFEGVEGRDAADALRGRTLLADPIDDPDVLWVHQLIGSTVVEADGTERGVVESVQSNPASDLLVLDTGALVPLVFVTGRSPGRVTIDPPEGLFDLG
ncbi:ribosome maturation factor RimM [Actinomarinicola tropica]|uniref:Ribosome maturation factor RimM n=1 Tax=Actinomarinicola tropica TaxID=2789776 RepID=A0A5Q2RLW7_9ACTN|nr:ribosome maturation factor RimM [Actinomarinicola tropica]QGG94850.1 16S rRNA processing protein RimM [Actinomarinicola tropica]